MAATATSSPMPPEMIMNGKSNPLSSAILSAAGALKLGML